MKKVILPPEFEKEFQNISFYLYGDMMVRIVWEYEQNFRIPIDDLHRAAARLMECNFPNLIALTFSWAPIGKTFQGTLVFVDPELFKFKPQPEWDGTCGPK